MKKKMEEPVAIGIRHGDMVRIMAGRAKGKSGKVLSVNRLKNTVTVEHANIIKKHTRPNPSKNIKGGILEKEGQLHSIQKAFGECYGLQCGYCTPGLMLSTYQLLSNNKQPSDQEIRKAIAGNTCRCTGYQNIFKAIQSAAQSSKGA